MDTPDPGSDLSRTTYTRRDLGRILAAAAAAYGTVVNAPAAVAATLAPRTSYDFNSTYGALKVYDQGQVGTCWHHAHGLGVVATQKMHGVNVGWTDPAVPMFVFAGNEYHATLAGKDHTVSAQQDSINIVDQAAMKAYLDKAGFATVSIVMPNSLYVWDSTALPVIHTGSTDRMVSGHDLFVAGYTANGLIVQNSWGSRWGYKGRAVFSWEWLNNFATDMAAESYDGYPLLGATRSPAAYVVPVVPYVYRRVLRLTSPLMYGADVRHLQLRLSFSSAAANGRFGLYTKGILIRRQKALGLPATGVLDAVSARRIG